MGRNDKILIKLFLIVVALCIVIGVICFLDTGYKPVSIIARPPEVSSFDGRWHSIKNQLTKTPVLFTVSNGMYSLRNFPIFSQFEDRARIRDPQVEYFSGEQGSSYVRTPSGWALKVCGEELMIVTKQNRIYLQQFQSVHSKMSIIYAKEE